MMSDETTITDITYEHFVNITKKLKLKPIETEANDLTLSQILDRHKNYQSFASGAHREKAQIQ